MTQNDKTIYKDEKKKKRSNRKGDYVTKQGIHEQLVLSHAQGKMTEKLAIMFRLMAEGLTRKWKFSDYTQNYIEDMIDFAMFMCVKNWHKFDLERVETFSYFNQVIFNAFRQYLNSEKKHRVIRDALLVANGLDPSFSFKEEGSNSSSSDDYGDE